MSGCATSARASATRCFCPPDIWIGYWLHDRAQLEGIHPARSLGRQRAARRVAPALAASRRRCSAPRSGAGTARSPGTGRPRGAPAGRHVHAGLAVEQHAAVQVDAAGCRAPSSPAIARSVRLLPAPGGAEHGDAPAVGPKSTSSANWRSGRTMRVRLATHAHGDSPSARPGCAGSGAARNCRQAARGRRHLPAGNHQHHHAGERRDQHQQVGGVGRRPPAPPRRRPPTASASCPAGCRRSSAWRRTRPARARRPAARRPAMPRSASGSVTRKNTPTRRRPARAPAFSSCVIHALERGARATSGPAGTPPSWPRSPRPAR